MGVAFANDAGTPYFIGVSSRPGVAVVTCLAVLSASCGAGWHRMAELDPGPLKPRQQIEVWAGGGGTPRRWHAVEVGPDSISGIPVLQATTCATCRTAVPLSAVDSVRLGHPVQGFWNTFGVAVLLPVLVFVIVCGPKGSCLTKD